jgi:hypothetical protein
MNLHPKTARPLLALLGPILALLAAACSSSNAPVDRGAAPASDASTSPDAGSQPEGACAVGGYSCKHLPCCSGVCNAGTCVCTGQGGNC